MSLDSSQELWDRYTDGTFYKIYELASAQDAKELFETRAWNKEQKLAPFRCWTRNLAISWLGLRVACIIQQGTWGIYLSRDPLLNRQSVIKTVLFATFKLDFIVSQHVDNFFKQSVPSHFRNTCQRREVYRLFPTHLPSRHEFLQREPVHCRVCNPVFCTHVCQSLANLVNWPGSTVRPPASSFLKRGAKDHWRVWGSNPSGIAID